MSRMPGYVRISVTDRCNLRCIYCRPAHEPKTNNNTLPADAVVRFARLAAQCGVRKIRLTGGEPLLHPEILRIVRGVTRVPVIEGVGLTTNGILLKGLAAPLRAAGLSSINVSLPSLKAEVFARVTLGGNLADVLDGVEAALGEGYAPVKLNVVVMRGVNDGEVCNLARLTRDKPLEVRFIEFMPFCELPGEPLVPNDEVLERMRCLGRLRRVSGPAGAATDRVYEVDGFKGRIGFISPMTHPVCRTCNRIRLTADGRLRACLIEGGELDARPVLNNGLDVDGLRELLLRCAAMKPPRHHGSFEGIMTCIGG